MIPIMDFVVLFSLTSGTPMISPAMLMPKAIQKLKASGVVFSPSCNDSQKAETTKVKKIIEKVIKKRLNVFINFEWLTGSHLASAPTVKVKDCPADKIVSNYSLIRSEI